MVYPAVLSDYSDLGLSIHEEFDPVVQRKDYHARLTFLLFRYCLANPRRDSLSEERINPVAFPPFSHKSIETFGPRERARIIIEKELLL